MSSFGRSFSSLAPEIATTLYPHQKKALTFLLERERETTGPNGTFSSLWRRHKTGMNGRDFWVHAVTEKEMFEEPQEAKGAILADDVCQNIMIVFYMLIFL